MILKTFFVFLFPILAHAQFFCNQFSISAYVDNTDHRAVKWTLENCPDYNWNLDLDLSVGKVRPLLQFVQGDWNQEMAMLLTKSNLDFNAITSDGKSFLLVALEMNRLSWFDQALSVVTTDITRTYGDEKLDLLEILIRQKNTSFLASLLKRQDLNINIAKQNRPAPIVQAIQNSDMDSISLLMARQDLDLVLKDRYKETPPLFAALALPKFEIVKLLLDDPRVPYFTDNYPVTPLVYALQKERDELFWNLVAHPKVKVNEPPNDSALLDEAMTLGRSDIVFILLDRYGLNPNIHKFGRNHLISNAVRSACNNWDDPSIIQNLLSRSDLEIPSDLSQKWVKTSLCSPQIFESFILSNRIPLMRDSSWMSSLFATWIQGDFYSVNKMIAVWQKTGLRLSDRTLPIGFLELWIQRNNRQGDSAAAIPFILAQDIDVNRNSSYGSTSMLMLLTSKTWSTENHFIAEALLARADVDPNQSFTYDCSVDQKVKRECKRSLWGEALANHNINLAKMIRQHPRFDPKKMGSMHGVFDHAVSMRDDESIEFILSRPDLNWAKDLTDNWGEVLRTAFYDFPERPLFLRLWKDRRIPRAAFFASDTWYLLNKVICKADFLLTKEFLDQLHSMKKDPVAEKKGEEISPLESAILCNKEDVFQELLRRNAGYMNLKTIRRWSDTDEELLSTPYSTALRKLVKTDQAKWLKAFISRAYDAEINLYVSDKNPDSDWVTMSAFSWSIKADPESAKVILAMPAFKIESEFERTTFADLIKKAASVDIVKAAIQNKKVSLSYAKDLLKYWDLPLDVARLLFFLPGFDLSGSYQGDILPIIKIIRNYPADMVEKAFTMQGFVVTEATNEQNAFMEVFERKNLDWAKRVWAHSSFDPNIGINWDYIASSQDPSWIQLLASHPKSNLEKLVSEKAISGLISNHSDELLKKVLQKYSGWDAGWILKQLLSSGERSEKDAGAIIEAIVRSPKLSSWHVIENYFDELARKLPSVAIRVQSLTTDPTVLNKLLNESLKENSQKITPQSKSVVAVLLKRKELKLSDSSILGKLAASKQYDLVTQVLKERGSEFNDGDYRQAIGSLLGNSTISENDEAWVDTFLRALKSWDHLRTRIHFDFYAAKLSRKDWMQQLIEKDSAIFEDDDFLNPGPLHYCAKMAWTDLMLQVLQKGENVNRVEKKFGMTALHMAVRAHRVESVRILVAVSGIDCNIKDKTGHTPLSWAQLLKDQEIIEILSN